MDYQNIDNYICAYCRDLLVEPISTLCGHNYCKYCIKSYLEHNGGASMCPTCKNSEIREPLGENIIIKKLIYSLFPKEIAEVTEERKNLESLFDKVKSYKNSKRDKIMEETICPMLNDILKLGYTDIDIITNMLTTTDIVDKYPDMDMEILYQIQKIVKKNSNKIGIMGTIVYSTINALEQALSNSAANNVNIDPVEYYKSMLFNEIISTDQNTDRYKHAMSLIQQNYNELYLKLNTKPPNDPLLEFVKNNLNSNFNNSNSFIDQD